MTEALRVYRRSELELIGDGCLYRYHKLWREMLDDVTDLSLVGIAGHAVKYAYVQRLVEKQIPQDAEEAQRAFVDGIAAAKTPSRLIPEVKKVWDWHAERFELPLEKYVAAEQKVAIGHIGFTPDLVLAHPERNELEITDDKWGWNPPLTEDALKMLFQARVYSRYGMRRWPGFTSYRFTLNAVRFGKFVSVVFTQSELDGVEIEIESAIATVNHCEATDQWPAVPGPACTYCELDCPAMRQDGDLPKRFTSEQQAQAVGSFLLASDTQTRALKKALKAYVAGHGPVEINGMVWDSRRATSRKYPLEEVLKVLQTRSVLGAFEPEPGKEPMTISYSALKKLFKEFPQLEADLAGVCTSKDSWRFSAKRDGVEDVEDDDAD